MQSILTAATGRGLFEGKGEMRRLRVFVPLFVLCSIAVGCPCVQPFDVPEFVDIEPNETGFLIPLEGATSKQMKFESAAHVEKLKVATKRVQITHRWVKTGRVWADAGVYMDDLRLLKVDRSPVTREWTTGTATGTSAKDQGVWAESKDSVGFSTGFSVTAMILEENAALFLYRYQSKSLAQVMDSEIKARVQAIVAEVSAEYDMSQLRAEKITIVRALRADVVPFFMDRGITITTVGMFGGFTYENAKIQESIDGVFIAQREKEVAEALLEAQADKNRVIEMEATAQANAAREVGRGEAEAKALILAVAKDAADDPVFLEMRKLEVDEARIQKWDGCYPTYYMSLGSNGNGKGPTLLIQPPMAKD